MTCKNKDIEVYHHFIREIVTSKEINLDYIPTYSLSKNIFTKTLFETKFVQHKAKLSFINSSSTFYSKVYIIAIIASRSIRTNFSSFKSMSKSIIDSSTQNLSWKVKFHIQLIITSLYFSPILALLHNALSFQRLNNSLIQSKAFMFCSSKSFYYIFTIFLFIIYSKLYSFFYYIKF
uniref:Reverse transcriptase Ty1/copia-type domain-containing protein n=1 Tax=Physcomitrium patens TaxID=3218 RepID=A0A2K1KKQ6_PHYPA|nr:hypothetical protein PHYPA_008034 [Physcomitrium patens]